MGTRIRLAIPEDGAALSAIYAPAVSDRATSFELDVPSAAEMARRVASLTLRMPWLVCEHGADVAGYAYASPHRDRAAYQWSVEVSAYVASRMQRRGVGDALYTSLFAVLELQGFRTAYAGITLPNDASVAFHTTLGFKPVGVYRGVGYKLGRWHDVAWFERPLAARTADPLPPRPLPDIVSDARFAAALLAGVARLSSSPETTPRG
jgi:phosphinothricin acetyltransferase